jgi:hypothetical protein
MCWTRLTGIPWLLRDAHVEGSRAEDCQTPLLRGKGEVASVPNSDATPRAVRRCLLRVLLGSVVTAACSVLMAATAQAADGEHRSGSAIAANADSPQATVGASDERKHEAGAGPTTSSEQPSVTDTEHTGDTAPGHRSDSGVQKTELPTKRVAERVRAAHQEVAGQPRDPAGRTHRAGHDVIKATREQPDPVAAGGREAAKVVKGAHDTVLSRVPDTVRERVGDVTDHAHHTIADTRQRVDRTREHIHPDGRLFEGRSPAGPHPVTGVELPPDQASGPQRHPDPLSTVGDPGAQAGRLGVTADDGASLGQRLADWRTESAVWQPANHANYPACPALGACAFTAASTNVQHGPDQRRTSGLAHVTRPSVPGSPWAVDRSPHDAWMLPSSPAFAPGVSPD